MRKVAHVNFAANSETALDINRAMNRKDVAVEETPLTKSILETSNPDVQRCKTTMRNHDKVRERWLALTTVEIPV